MTEDNVGATATAGQHLLNTRAVGFIGCNLSWLLLAEAIQVRGYDGMTDYYKARLKECRYANPLQDGVVSATEGMHEDQPLLDEEADHFHPDVIGHLAVQAGARY